MEKQPQVSRQADQGSRSQHLVLHSLGRTVQPLFVDNCQLGKRAGTAHQPLVAAPDSVPHGESLGPLATRLDRTGQVAADRVGEVQFDGHQPAADVGVDRVDRHRLDSHHDDFHID